MRLLNTKTYELFERNELPDNGKLFPPYAILSHTWLEEGPEGVKEVTYQDMKKSFLALKRGRLKTEGWDKLKRYCDRAALDGWEWAWMDTCCIDKTNIGDTQEAINAMFRWYRDSMICYAYLDDVDGFKWSREDSERFSRARWFTRGWTIQELVAPHFLLFVDRNWRDIDTRQKLSNLVFLATGIRMSEMGNLDRVPVATKLAWASHRETTLEEDRAYSLLGVLGVTMPLVYGEGKGAFIRLQQELIKTHHDYSILCWHDPFHDDDKSQLEHCGVLAPSPSYFSSDYKVEYTTDYRTDPTIDSPEMFTSNSFEISNRGVHLTVSLYSMSFRGMEISVAQLHCYIFNRESEREYPGLYLIENADGTYSRVWHHRKLKMADDKIKDAASTRLFFMGDRKITIKHTPENELPVHIVNFIYPENDLRMTADEDLSINNVTHPDFIQYPLVGLSFHRPKDYLEKTEFLVFRNPRGRKSRHFTFRLQRSPTTEASDEIEIDYVSTLKLIGNSVFFSFIRKRSWVGSELVEAKPLIKKAYGIEVSRGVYINALLRPVAKKPGRTLPLEPRLLKEDPDIPYPDWAIPRRKVIHVREYEVKVEIIKKGDQEQD